MLKLRTLNTDYIKWSYLLHKMVMYTRLTGVCYTHNNHNNDVVQNCNIDYNVISTAVRNSPILIAGVDCCSTGLTIPPTSYDV